MKEYALVGRVNETGEYELFFPRWYWDPKNKLITGYGQRGGHGATHMDYVTGGTTQLLFDLDEEAMAFVRSYADRARSFLDEPVELDLLSQSFLQDTEQEDPPVYATVCSPMPEEMQS